MKRLLLYCRVSDQRRSQVATTCIGLPMHCVAMQQVIVCTDYAIVHIKWSHL
jgi:hypothetical protein